MWHVNWSSLSYASWLLVLLSTSATVLYVGVMIGLNEIKRQSEHYVSKNSLMTWMYSTNVPERVRLRVSSWIPSVTLFIVGYVLGAASLFSPVRELHMVEVLGKNAPRTYSVFIPAFYNPGKTDLAMTIKLCPEGDDLPLKSGMILEPFQYIQEADCLLINQDTHVDWLRDKDKNVVDKNGRILFAKD